MLPRHLRARLLTVLCVGALTASAVLGLVTGMPARGLAQPAPRTGRAAGDGVADLAIDGQTVEGCTFRLRVDSALQPPGTFICQVSDQAVGVGVPFSSLRGTVESITALSAGATTATGTADLQLPDGQSLQDVTFVLRADEGGPGQGGFRVQLVGVFDGEPGDAVRGNGNYDQVWQTVTDGSIRITIEPSPAPSPSPSESPSPTPSPSPSETPSPTPSETPSPSPTRSPSPIPSHTPFPTPFPSSSPPGGPGPSPPSPAFPLTPLPVPPAPDGANTSAPLMALLAEVSPTGTPRLSAILKVVGPFPVAGLAWWHNDWHAYRCCPFPHLHEGLDMFAEIGTPVVAAADGVVSQRVTNSISGLGVEITDPADTQYFYAHLSAFVPGLALGQHVHVGQVIGYVGNTGDAIATSPHLHFEVQPHGIPVPPKPYVDAWLLIAEQKAESLVASQVGHAILNPDTLAYWLAKADTLHALSDFGEGSDGIAPGAALTATRTDPSPVSAGFLLGMASLMLLIALIAPASLAGRREARRTPPPGPGSPS